MLKSNIKSVIARMEALQQGLPGCVDRAMAKDYWTPLLRVVAGKSLQAQWAMVSDPATRASYERMLPMILDTVMGSSAPGTHTFELWLPSDSVNEVNVVAAANYASAQWTPMGRARKWAMPDPLGEQNLQAARQAVLDWVMVEKEWDERDAGKTPEQIAEYVEMVLGLRPAFHEREQTMDLAAEKLRGAIEAWLNGDETTPSGNHAIQTPATDPTRHLPKRAASSVTNGLAKQWLDAVLQSWYIFLHVHISDRVDDEIKKLWQKVKKSQQELL